MGWAAVHAASGALVRPGFREGGALRKGLDTPGFDFILEQGSIFSVTPDLP